MNVLHVHSGNIFGGVERMLETLAPATAGRAPISSSFALCFEGVVSDTLRAAGAEVHHLGPVHARRFDQIWRARRALSRVLASRPWNTVCVHSAWTQALLGPPIVERPLPLVRWLHAPDAGPTWLEYWASRSRPQLVLCNSNYTMEAARKRLGTTPSAVRYPPAHAPARDDHARTDVRRHLGTPPPAVVIMIAARMEQWKGHDILLESLSTLPRTGWEAWIVGGPQQPSERRYFESLLDRARTLGLEQQVRFLGQRSDVRRLLQAADIYCQPNRGAEPFGLTFVEALAAGLPVITTKLGAAPEIVDDSCGVLVEAGCVSAVARVLRTMIEDGDRRQVLSAGARDRGRQLCDLSTSLSELAAELARASTTSPALS